MTSEDAAPSEFEPIGVTVARLALDPVSGRVRNRRAVGIAIRGAHLAELGLAGHLTGKAGPRTVSTTTSSAGDPLLDAVFRAVASRPRLAWKRWFSHTDDDIAAIGRRLTEAGRWQLRDDGFVDLEAGRTLEQAVAVRALVNGPLLPASALEGLLTMLVAGSGAVDGRPRPRAQKPNVTPWLDPFLTGPAGSPPDTARRAVLAALRAMRGQAIVPLLSR